MTQAELELLWTRRAAALARRLNTAWWLERFNALALVGFLLFASVLLLVRTWRSPWLDPIPVFLVIAALLALCAILAWWLGRARFVDAAVGLVRLDDRLGLHNRLVSARAGIGPWPEPPAHPAGTPAFPWSGPRACVPGLASLALVAVAWWMPLRQGQRAAVPAVEPGAWEQMDDWLAALREEELADEKAVEDFADRIEELRDRPEQEWFAHSSLEATDALHDAFGREIRDLAAEMNALERNLAALRAFAGEMGEESRQRLARGFEEALEALGGGALPLDGALREQLAGIDPSQFGRGGVSGLSPEQLEALRERLRQGAQSLGSLEGLPQAGEGECLLSEFGFGEGEGEMPGRGGISRGRGDAPLRFGEEDGGLGSSTLEAVSNEDFSRATLGEVLGIGESERKIDEAAVGPVAGGAISSAGRGGDAVSRESLLPDEQAVLKRYFK